MSQESGWFGLAFEVELVRPANSEWEMIVRCVGGLPDNFAVPFDMLPPDYEQSNINGRALTRCRLLPDSQRDRFGKTRVDMVGVVFADADSADQFVAAQQVVWSSGHDRIASQG